jgi:REP element-mobilizing transposase RayT
MAHTYVSNRVQVVFSTKNRSNLIPDELQSKLWAYLAGIGRNHGVLVFCAGGTGNHVHLLIALPATMPLAKAVQVLKANSSKWLGEHGMDFAWQEAYGAFSVSASGMDATTAYIENQAEHHKKHSFEDEFRSLLIRYGIPFNEKYVFG